MSHKIYHTEGFIVGGVNTGEANRYISIFTKDLGLVRAMAQGVRKITSKLRYSLQDFSYPKIDLVAGRDIWRITNAEKLFVFDKAISDPKLFKVFARILKLLKRLCPGEEKNEELFEDLKSSFIFLENETLTKEKLEGFELSVVLRTLYHLGYFGGKEDLDVFVKNPINHELLQEAYKKRKTIVVEINQSLQESQL